MQIGRTILLTILVFSLLTCPSTFIATQVFKDASTNEDPQIPVTAQQTFEGCAGPVIATINPDFEQAVIEQTNTIRMEHGLPPLKHVEALDRSARYHSADMSVNDYFDHNTYNRVDDKLVEVCDTWSRIENYYDHWEALAENIAAGQRVPEMAMNGWMNSPDHRHNILSDSYWEIGVGFYEGKGEYRWYWDQNFGRRDGIFPLILDGEKAKTQTRTVPVYIYGDFNQMRLRNDKGGWSAWMPFQQSFTWELLETAGIHTVTAQLRGNDSVVTSSDTIELVP